MNQKDYYNRLKNKRTSYHTLVKFLDNRYREFMKKELLKYRQRIKNLNKAKILYKAGLEKKMADKLFQKKLNMQAFKYKKKRNKLFKHHIKIHKDVKETFQTSIKNQKIKYVKKGHEIALHKRKWHAKEIKTYKDLLRRYKKKYIRLAKILRYSVERYMIKKDEEKDRSIKTYNTNYVNILKRMQLHYKLVLIKWDRKLKAWRKNSIIKHQRWISSVRSKYHKDFNKNQSNKIQSGLQINKLKKNQVNKLKKKLQVQQRQILNSWLRAQEATEEGFYFWFFSQKKKYQKWKLEIQKSIKKTNYLKNSVEKKIKANERFTNKHHAMKGLRNFTTVVRKNKMRVYNKLKNSQPHTIEKRPIEKDSSTSADYLKYKEALKIRFIGEKRANNKLHAVKGLRKVVIKKTANLRKSDRHVSFKKKIRLHFEPQYNVAKEIQRRDYEQISETITKIKKTVNRQTRKQIQKSDGYYKKLVDETLKQDISLKSQEALKKSVSLWSFFHWIGSLFGPDTYYHHRVVVRRRYYNPYDHRIIVRHRYYSPYHHRMVFRRRYRFGSRRSHFRRRRYGRHLRSPLRNLSLMQNKILLRVKAPKKFTKGIKTQKVNIRNHPKEIHTHIVNKTPTMKGVRTKGRKTKLHTKKSYRTKSIKMKQMSTYGMPKKFDQNGPMKWFCKEAKRILYIKEYLPRECNEIHKKKKMGLYPLNYRN